MQVELRYGTDGIKVECPETPNFRGVLRPGAAAPLADPEAELARVLDRPIDSDPLTEIARGRGDAVIVISDVTRPVPNTLLLPGILARLEAAGLPAEAITILVATGIHRPTDPAELVGLVGGEIAERYRVVDHLSKEQDDMVLVGEIADGVPAYVNRRYVEADLKILTGFIEPHMWAGYSGGRKSILPGISAAETLTYMHGPEMVAHPMTAYGVLDGNPFHEAGLEVMAKVGADFIVNVTLDTEKRVTGIYAGDPVTAHLRGVDALAEHCLEVLDEPLDFVVTTNSGAPLDLNLYQTSKGLSGVAGATREGGVILIASECREGFGSDEYREVFEHATTPQEFIDRIMAGEFFVLDQWCAQETYQVRLKNEIWIHTEGIDDDTLERLHFRPVADLDAAIEELLDRFGRDARWAVVPDGPLLILRVDD
ncbi:MAG: nickel-dependent lactate racemase [Actinomycetota bacterium]